jgi:hypothetical protein
MVGWGDCGSSLRCLRCPSEVLVASVTQWTSQCIMLKIMQNHNQRFSPEQL